jgi:predicted nucleic acid-binding Zn ribbon protein
MIVINLKQCSAIYDAIQILSDSDSQRCEAKKTVLRRILEVEANL